MNIFHPAETAECSMPSKKKTGGKNNSKTRRFVAVHKYKKSRVSQTRKYRC